MLGSDSIVKILGQPLLWYTVHVGVRVRQLNRKSAWPTFIGAGIRPVAVPKEVQGPDNALHAHSNPRTITDNMNTIGIIVYSSCWNKNSVTQREVLTSTSTAYMAKKDLISEYYPKIIIS